MSKEQVLKFVNSPASQDLKKLAAAATEASKKMMQFASA